MATMERPRPSATEEESATPAVSSTSAAAADTKTKESATETQSAQPLPSNPEEAVEALEKRLEGLGGVATPVVAEEKPAAASAPAAPAPAAAAKAPAGKNALLVSQSSSLLFVRVWDDSGCCFVIGAGLWWLVKWLRRRWGGEHWAQRKLM